MNDLTYLQTLCKQVRHYILTSTTKAGSGHPTSSLCAVELLTTLFFGGYLKYDINNPHAISNDRVIFSKGHASPLLYSLWTVAGAISKEELLTLRTFGSRLEGHPTPTLPFVDVATGSLGQGLSVGMGMALALKNIVNESQTLNPKSQPASPKLPLRLRIEASQRGESNSKSKIPKEKNDLEFRVSDLEFTKILPRIFVLLGDSELAEGQNWEAMEIASHYKLNNLVGILDVNRLGQRGATMLGWDLETYQKRIESFGWNTIVVEEGHNIAQILAAYNRCTDAKCCASTNPTMIIAKTIKGKGVSFLENQVGWHGKVVPKERLRETLFELGDIDWTVKGKIEKPIRKDFAIDSVSDFFPASALPPKGGMRAVGIPKITATYGNIKVATRQAYGDALVSLGKQNSRIVVLDAETSNSTFADKFNKVFPNRFFEMFIAEQNMVSVALGFSKIGFIPFVSSFAAFLTRAFDQIRMAQYSFVGGGSLRAPDSAEQSEHWREKNFQQDPQSSFNIVGSHAGCSIGEDGASQMALEDIAMMRSIRESTVLYPSDAVSTAKLTSLLADNLGISYLRLTREKTPIIYNEREEFKIGGCKVHYPTTNQQRETSNVFSALIISAGITFHESLKAQKILFEKGINVVVIDLYSIKPLDEKTILELTKQTNHIIVVEDHYEAGGIGEAVFSFLATYDQRPTTQPHFTHLCVRKLPHSGKPHELLRYEEIDAEAIINEVLKT